MAPGYRNRDRDRERDRRQNRTGYVDHDIFEGLPVRHWRRDYVTVAPAPAQDNNSSDNDVWAVELPHGMPKDSHLLPQHSQDLLRAVRSGRIYKRPPPLEEEEADPDVLLGEKPEKKEDEHKDKGFTARAWKQIPRHLEGPDIEYLAKRRKGLVAFVPKAKVSAPTLTKATVKRIDAAGNEYVQDIVIPHGQKVEGEIIKLVEVPDPTVSAPLGDAFAVTPRKKGPIIRKKSKPVGKSKRKKPAAPTSAPQTVELNGAAQAGAVSSDQPTATIPATENGGDSVSANNEDTEMAEGSNAASDDDEGEEGEECEDLDGNDDGGTPLDTQDTIQFLESSHPIPSVKREPSDSMSSAGEESTQSLGANRPDLESESRDIKMGSPLKNVALTGSDFASIDPLTATSALPLTQSKDSPQHGSAEGFDTIADAVTADIQQVVAEYASADLPATPPHPADTEVAASLEVRDEEEEEEKMLLDIVENTNNSLEGVHQDVESNLVDGAQIHPEVDDATVTASREPEGQNSEPPITALDHAAESEKNGDDDVADDDFPDLLGSLEEQLNKPVDAAPGASV